MIDINYIFMNNYVFVSAILTAGSPDKVAFMADEATYAILDTTTLKYSLSEYMCFMNAVRDTVIKLRKDGKIYLFVC